MEEMLICVISLGENNVLKLDLGHGRLSSRPHSITDSFKCVKLLVLFYTQYKGDVEYKGEVDKSPEINIRGRWQYIKYKGELDKLLEN